MLLFPVNQSMHLPSTAGGADTEAAEGAGGREAGPAEQEGGVPERPGETAGRSEEAGEGQGRRAAADRQDGGASSVRGEQSDLKDRFSYSDDPDRESLPADAPGQAQTAGRGAEVLLDGTSAG